MSKVYIIVAKEEEGLKAVADVRKLTIIENTKSSFTSLATCKDTTMQNIGDIDTGKHGWVALAEK